MKNLRNKLYAEVWDQAYEQMDVAVNRYVFKQAWNGCLEKIYDQILVQVRNHTKNEFSGKKTL